VEISMEEKKQEPPKKDVAGPGEIFVCSACGKTSKRRTPTGRGGWDESCMMHAILCYEKKGKDGAWVAVQPS
jgi:hypothetical protein